MVIKVKNAILSAFYGALGPFFNKQATLDETRPIFKYLSEREIAWAIYPFDIACFVIMLVVNTMSVKYKMLSYKYDGAFLGTSLIFVLGYGFSAIFDYIYEGEAPSLRQTLGAFMMITGIILISSQEEEEKVIKKTNSFYEIIAEDGGQEPKAGAEENDPRTERFLDKSKSPDGNLPQSVGETDASSPAGGQQGSLSLPAMTDKSQVSARSPSRQRPGEMAAIDFVHMRKGYL